MIDGPEFKSGGARLGGPLLVNRASIRWPRRWR
jgi:hypothetical protein